MPLVESIGSESFVHKVVPDDLIALIAKDVARQIRMCIIHPRIDDSDHHAESRRNGLRLRSLNAIQSILIVYSDAVGELSMIAMVLRTASGDWPK